MCVALGAIDGSKRRMGATLHGTRSKQKNHAHSLPDNHTSSFATTHVHKMDPALVELGWMGDMTWRCVSLRATRLFWGNHKQGSKRTRTNTWVMRKSGRLAVVFSFYSCATAQLFVRICHYRANAVIYPFAGRGCWWSFSGNPLAFDQQSVGPMKLALAWEQHWVYYAVPKKA